MSSTPKWKELEDEIKILKENTKIITGQECKTNEFIDGKQVYVKRINFGELPGLNEQKEVETGLSASEVLIVRIDGTAEHTEIESVIPINIAFNNFLHIGCFFTEGKLRMRSEDDRSKYIGFINIYYIKK